MFKDAFKYYKSRKPQPELDEILDFDKAHNILPKINKISIPNYETSRQKFGLKPVQDWDVYEIIAHPGLLFIRNPFTSIAHRYWAVRCLRDYSRKPNKSNVDASLNLDEWWNLSQQDNKTKESLRWITLGYHHNWDTKVYSEDSKSDFPADFAHVSAYIARALGFSSFRAEAAIINFYHMDSTLSGHTDHSEQNLEAPLISFSFGQTAIFLLGGRTREEKPSAMFLRSGDVVVMSKESRLCYHGVPKILRTESEVWNDFKQQQEEDDTIFGEESDCQASMDVCRNESLWRPFSDYLSSSRINVNVRQVLQPGQKRLCVSEDQNGPS